MRSTPVENSTINHTEIMVRSECGNEINPGRKLHRQPQRSWLEANVAMKSTPVENSTINNTEIMVRSEEDQPWQKTPSPTRQKSWLEANVAMRSTPVENSTVNQTEIMVRSECGNEINPGRKLHHQQHRDHG